MKKKKLRCPNKRCRSYNIETINSEKGYSVTKGLTGAAIGGLFNPAAGVAGLLTGISGKNKKAKFHCKDCGTIFKKKV